MDTCRPCGCKGCRTCLICENELGIQKEIKLNKDFGSYVYCPYCDKAWPGWNMDDYKLHPNHFGEPIEYPGVYIKLNFITEEEEGRLLEGIDSMTWDASVSGRRKQNYGPKCNFKKKKLRLGDFNGFPQYSKFIQDKFYDIELLKKFQTIEQCSLEYDSKRGASIDPHIDDCWIWGERIITLNLLSDSVLTMTTNSKPDYYNLKQVIDYPSVVIGDKPYNLIDKKTDNPVIRIPMPSRSLLVLYGSARYDWEHQILRDDIENRRVCIAYREFTPPYLEGGHKYLEGKEILQCATNYF